MKRICVFCGSQVGKNELYQSVADELGKLLVQNHIGLVFGGGSIGLMGVLADSVLSSGGEVIGVIPSALATKELLHPNVPDMRCVASMHDRKALMSELADAFIALPGGYGTFEELFEVITWAQLGFQRKNIGLLNIAGFFDPLIRFIDHAVEEQFISDKHRSLIVVENKPDELLKELASHPLPEVPEWLSRDSI